MIRVPFGALIGLAVLVAGASVVAMGAALVAVTRIQAASVLREQ